MKYLPASKPTLHFIGVTTGQSSIMRVFPAWADFLGLGDVAINGMDFKPQADPSLYREAVEHIRDDPLSLGALVTTHKLDLYNACHDLFDSVDPHAKLMTETSCISMQGQSLVCHAKDPVCAGLSIDGFLPAGHFSGTQGALLCIGAGGAAVALTWHLLQTSRGTNRPSRIVVSDLSEQRLAHIKSVHKAIDADISVDYVLVQDATDNDRILQDLPTGSMIVNATGLGKDTPGSPLSAAASFPEQGIVWELNYRGELVFMDQARAQQSRRSLQIADGWSYFIYGWTQVIAEVFHIDVPVKGPGFEQISRIAAEVGKPS